MTREPWWRAERDGEAPTGPDRDDRLQGVLDWFMQSRLFTQVVVSVGLLAVAGAVAALPFRQAQQARTAFAWVVREDYDFAGKAGAAKGWAQAQGGWWPALTAIGRAGRERLEEFAAKLHVPGLPAPSSAAAVARPAMPVDGSVLTEYGWPRQGAQGKFHEGVDIAAQVGAPVVAALDGKVTRVAADPAYGNRVEIDHGKVFTVYAEVTELAVQVGDEVRRGQRIAVVSAPAGAEQSLPPHLHFEVRAQRGGYSIDPASFLGLGGSKL